MLDKTVMKKTHLNDTLCNPFGKRDYIIYVGNQTTLPDWQRTWLSECCGKEDMFFDPDISVYGVTGRCGRCEELVGFIEEKEFSL